MYINGVKPKIVVTHRWCSYHNKKGRKVTINEYLITGLSYPRIVNPRKKESLTDRTVTGDSFIHKAKVALGNWQDRPNFEVGARELSVDDMLELAANVSGMFYDYEMTIFRIMNDALMEKVRTRAVKLSRAFVRNRESTEGLDEQPMRYRYHRSARTI